jgi:hypothetical protein
MKALSTVVTATVAATILLVNSATANSQPAQTGTPATTTQAPAPMPMHPQGMMGMAAMQGEPHHLLAMAYKDTLVTFAKSLRQGTTGATTVDTVFARAAVEEMTRSFAQMQLHHLDHAKAMDEKMKASMADMMTQMDTHHAAIQEHLTALEQDVQASAPDAKSITTHATAIITQCEGMSKMQAGTMPHKMGQL